MVLDQALNRLLAYMQCIAPIYTNCFCIYVRNISILQGRIQAFKLGGGEGGAHLKKFWCISCEKSRFYAKKIRFFPNAEGSAKIFGVFRVKNHDFTPKTHIFSNFRGGAHWVHPPLNPPLYYTNTLHYCLVILHLI